MTALLLFCLLSFCYSVFFTSNLFLCLSVTLSFLRAICFFVFLLLCLFTSNLFLCPFVTLSFLQAICFFVLLLLCLLLQATCQLVHSSTRQLVIQLLKILNIVFTTMNIRKNMFIFAVDFMK